MLGDKQKSLVANDLGKPGTLSSQQGELIIEEFSNNFVIQIRNAIVKMNLLWEQDGSKITNDHNVSQEHTSSVNFSKRIIVETF